VRIEGNGAARERIDTVLASVRDESAVKRIRVALDPDLDDATRELEDMGDIDATVHRI
jgi:hypothetical protein